MSINDKIAERLENIKQLLGDRTSSDSDVLGGIAQEASDIIDLCVPHTNLRVVDKWDLQYADDPLGI